MQTNLADFIRDTPAGRVADASTLGRRTPRLSAPSPSQSPTMIASEGRP